MQWEDSLDPFTVGNTADGECFVQSAALAADNDAGKNLDSFLIAFHDTGMHPHPIADLEIGYVGLQLFLLNCVDNTAHNDSSGPLAGGHLQSLEGKNQGKMKFPAVFAPSASFSCS